MNFERGLNGSSGSRRIKDRKSGFFRLIRSTSVQKNSDIFAGTQAPLPATPVPPTG